MAPGSEEARRMQAQIDNLADKLGKLSESMGALAAVQAANHNQNRGDIHRLNGSVDAALNTIAIGFEKIGDKLSSRMDKHEEKVSGMFVGFKGQVDVSMEKMNTRIGAVEMQVVKIFAYATGAGLVLGASASIAKFALDHWLK